MHELGDERRRSDLIRRIGEAERAADKVTHDTVSLLHSTFITPFDRNDIHRLISNMDDILDLIQDTAEAVHLYDMKQLPPEAPRLVRLLEASCERVQAAVQLLPSMDNAAKMLAIAQEIDSLESEADEAMRDRDLATIPRGAGRPPAHQAQERLRVPRGSHGQVPGRRQRHRVGRRRERLSMDLTIPFATLVVLVAIALVFDFMNGFHDAANSIATVVSTGVLRPHQAVRLGRVLQFRRDLHLPPEGRGDGRQGHRRPARDRSLRDLRRADRRDRLEPDHLVLRHPVELLACADRRHDRRDDRQGGDRRRCSRPESSRPRPSSSSRRCSG